MTGTEKVLKTVEMAMAVNDTTKHDVFVNISPHVEGLDVQIYMDGWRLGAFPDMYYRGSYQSIPAGMLIDDKSVDDIWAELENLLKEDAQ